MKKFPVHVDLSSGENPYRKVNHPGSISSGGMDPCIAIGIFDKIKRCIYMIHISNASQDKNIPGFLKLVLKYSEPKNLKIWVRGGAMDNNNESLVGNDRDFIEKFVQENFASSETDIQWTEQNFGCELTLDTDGKAVTKKFDMRLSDENSDDF